MDVIIKCWRLTPGLIRPCAIKKQTQTVIVWGQQCTTLSNNSEKPSPSTKSLKSHSGSRYTSFCLSINWPLGAINRLGCDSSVNIHYQGFCRQLWMRGFWIWPRPILTVSGFNCTIEPSFNWIASVWQIEWLSMWRGITRSACGTGNSVMSLCILS
jgi:hypothetical protein